MARPNIVLILVDDMGWRDLGCQGSTFYETPVIDALAGRGMRFTDAHASCPVCSPTRASILTGKYPARVGITDWIDWGGRIHPARGRLVDVPYVRDLPLSEETVAQALKDAGYATWHVGKWHLGREGNEPQDVGFDINIGGCQDGSPGRGGYFSPWSIRALQEADVQEGTYLTDYLGDQAVRLIEGHDNTPFFLNVWFYTVHTPIQGKPDLVEKYRAKRESLGLDQVPEFVEGGFFPSEHKRDKRITRRVVQSDPVYAAMVQSLDENVGKIIDALERTGRAEDTLILFTSDNGGLATSEGSPTCNAPLAEGKGWMYEGGTREPLFVCWPKAVKPGSRCDIPVISTDFYPTILEAAGLPLRPAQHVDGMSLMPALQGDTTFDRGPIFWHYPHYGNQGGTPSTSVRKGRHKLIRFFEDGHEELYDLSADIGETQNLAKKDVRTKEELSGVLSQWQDDIEALLPRANTDYEEWPDREPCAHYPDGTGPEV